ncbi:MAG: FAD-dependent oxidoreductase [Chloroflexota bacterium]
MSDQKRFVIVGNGVAGTTCAETLRKEDPSCQVTLITSERWPLYNRVALPPFIKGRTPREKVLMRTIEQHAERGIDLRTETRATAIDTHGHAVTLESGETLPYDAMLLATGGRPNPLSVPGASGTQNVFNFQWLDDAEAIVEAMGRSTRAAVTGGSYIAYELTEGFRHRGLETFWLIRGPYFLRRVLDPDGGALVDDIARSHGVRMIYGETIKQVIPADGRVKGLVTSADQTIGVDMIGVGLGMTMNVELAKDAAIDVREGIVVDEYLESNAPGVFAAGDVAEFMDVTIGRHNMMGTWGNALGHGKAAALNMLGRRIPYEDIPMYSSTLFDSYIRVIGLTPEAAPDLESFEHLDAGSKSYQRLFFMEGRLVGACLIGDMRFRQKIFTCIKSREVVPVSERAHLLD